MLEFERFSPHEMSTSQSSSSFLGTFLSSSADFQWTPNSTRLISDYLRLHHVSIIFLDIYPFLRFYLELRYHLKWNRFFFHLSQVCCLHRLTRCESVVCFLAAIVFEIVKLCIQWCANVVDVPSSWTSDLHDKYNFQYCTHTFYLLRCNHVSIFRGIAWVLNAHLCRTPLRKLYCNLDTFFSQESTRIFD